MSNIVEISKFFPKEHERKMLRQLKVEDLKDTDGRYLRRFPVLLAKLHAAKIYTDVDFMECKDWSTVFTKPIFRWMLLRCNRIQKIYREAE
jgi:hypothetical protein